MHASQPAPSSTSGDRLTGVDEAFGIADRPLVESGDPGRECLDERIEFGIGQRAVDAAVRFSLIGPDVIRAEQHFECAVSADESGQPSHGSAGGDHSNAHFPLRNDRLFAASETHITGQREFAAVAGCPAADKRNGCDRQTRQTREKVRPRRQSGGTVRHRGQVLELGREIGVIEEIAVDRAVEHHDSYMFVGLESVHHSLETRTIFGPITLSGGLSIVTRQ
jgi:hypothetical protein